MTFLAFRSGASCAASAVVSDRKDVECSTRFCHWGTVVTWVAFDEQLYIKQTCFGMGEFRSLLPVSLVVVSFE